MNNQKTVYETAKNLNVQTKYAAGWYNHPDCGFGWQVVRMKDDAIIFQSGEISLVELKAKLFDMGINKNDISIL